MSDNDFEVKKFCEIFPRGHNLEIVIFYLSLL